MQLIRILAMATLLIVITPSHAVVGDDRGLTNTANSPHAQFGTVDIDDVRWTDGFWADRFESCRTDMLSHMVVTSGSRQVAQFRMASKRLL